ncbi:hypothetical protein ACFLZ7_03115 [Nanoarchaeota archaeon]
MKKAQIHMGENVAILFIFFILLVVSIVFYARLTETKVGIEQEEAFAGKAIEISQRLSYLPETQCSKDNIIEENCYDLHKLIALSNINKKTENRAHYYNMFRQANITIQQIFPEPTKINVYNFVPEDYTEKSQVQIPISICDFTQRPEKCSFSIMIVDVFR